MQTCRKRVNFMKWLSFCFNHTYLQGCNSYNLETRYGDSSMIAPKAAHFWYGHGINIVSIACSWKSAVLYTSLWSSTISGKNIATLSNVVDFFSRKGCSAYKPRLKQKPVVASKCQNLHKHLALCIELMLMSDSITVIYQPNSCISANPLHSLNCTHQNNSVNTVCFGCGGSFGLSLWCGRYFTLSCMSIL